MQQPLEDEYLKRKTTNPPKDPAKGSHENSEPPDNPARVTDEQNKKASKRSLQTTSRLSSEVPGEPQTLYLLLSHFIYITDNQTLFYL